MEELLKGFEIGNKFYEETKDLPQATFFSVIAMTIDSYCAKNGLNPVECAEDLADQIRVVNELLGPIEL